MNRRSVYIIAEAGVNHNGRLDLAFGLIDAAVEAGADAVKFQTFDAEKLASKTVSKAAYQKNNTNEIENQFEMLKKLELPRLWHVDLQKYAHQQGIEFLSTAFDKESLDFLDELAMPLFKVPSGELTNGPLIWHFSQINRPLIISTGMATLSEVEQALAIVAYGFSKSTEPTSMDEVWRSWSQKECRDRLHKRVTLLHCTSQYPTQFTEVNLRGMDTLASAFGLDIGYSDHTEGTLIPIAAVARGATVIEKHLTLDRNLLGPDHRASLEPSEFTKMVRDIRGLECALGDGYKSPQPSEWDTSQVARQQIVAARNIAVGSVLLREDLATARCGRGLPANEVWGLVGQVASRNYKAGEIFEI